jgi:aminoglycoside 6-adenylyltransferase
MKMRNEQEMMDLIINFARNEDCIRIVTMEGSKLNKNVPVDKFQDYDITYIVSDMKKYLKSDNWLDIFGKRIIMQKPEDMDMFPPTLGNWHSYLMIFEDGNRIDLKIVPLNETEKYFKWDGSGSLCKILLDKDSICPLLNEPSDIDFHVRKPSKLFVDDCCNEFWWLSTYVTKGLCRNELLYAIKHLNLMKEQMFTMISWKVGMETLFSLSVGKAYKYLDKYISKEMWKAIMETYKNGTIETVWDSLIICCNIFQEVTKYVSNELGYKCPEYNRNVIKYIRQYFPKEKMEKIRIV